MDQNLHFLLLNPKSGPLLKQYKNKSIQENCF